MLVRGERPADQPGGADRSRSHGTAIQEPWGPSNGQRAAPEHDGEYGGNSSARSRERGGGEVVPADAEGRSIVRRGARASRAPVDPAEALRGGRQGTDRGARRAPGPGCRLPSAPVRGTS